MEAIPSKERIPNVDEVAAGEIKDIESSDKDLENNHDILDRVEDKAEDNTAQPQDEKLSDDPHVSDEEESKLPSIEEDKNNTSYTNNRAVADEALNFNPK